MGVRLRKCEFLGVEDFESISQLRNEGGLRNGTRMPKGCFAAAKIFTEGVHEAAKSFRSRRAFLQRGLGDFVAKGYFRRGPF